MSLRTKADSFAVGSQPQLRTMNPGSSNVGAVLVTADRLRTHDAQVKQLYVGSDTASQDLLQFGGATTASLVESTSLIDASAGNVAVTLPMPTQTLTESELTAVGLMKVFVMTTVPGLGFSATIVPVNQFGPQPAEATSLNQQWQTATYMWSETGWSLVATTGLTPISVQQLLVGTPSSLQFGGLVAQGQAPYPTDVLAHPAGGAAALPATPLGYLHFVLYDLVGPAQNIRVPYYPQ